MVTFQEFAIENHSLHCTAPGCFFIFWSVSSLLFSFIGFWLSVTHPEWPASACTCCYTCICCYCNYIWLLLEDLVWIWLCLTKSSTVHSITVHSKNKYVRFSPPSFPLLSQCEHVHTVQIILLDLMLMCVKERDRKCVSLLSVCLPFFFLFLLKNQKMAGVRCVEL